MALVGFGAGGSLALAGEFSPPDNDRNKKGQRGQKPAPRSTPTPSETSPGQAQYGTRPGKGCGDRNHVHTGPPGNPSNTECPTRSGSKKSSTKRKSASCKTGKGKGKANGKSKARNKKNASKRSKGKSCKRGSSKSKSKSQGKSQSKSNRNKKSNGRKRSASRR